MEKELLKKAFEEGCNCTSFNTESYRDTRFEEWYSKVSVTSPSLNEKLGQARYVKENYYLTNFTSNYGKNVPAAFAAMCCGNSFEDGFKFARENPEPLSVGEEAVEKEVAESQQKQSGPWTYKEHTYALADTGDYEGYVQFTNGKDIWQTCGDNLEKEHIEKFCELLNLMPDLWSHKMNGLEFEKAHPEAKGKEVLEPSLVQELINALEDAITGVEWKIDNDPLADNKADEEKLHEWKKLFKKVKKYQK